ncbi:hypothetical protein CGSHi3655_08204 [Haemophilus influenzae 3655]|uniref:Uncharacterized protein n=1 Tax=Haemophilus influenzae (strain NTHi 3655) TaxID=375177 RepID=A0A0H3PPM1_HAEI3|nr:hypothetical protein CGSHi3655_08204 [Haemophilus influenzae 3655]
MFVQEKTKILQFKHQNTIHFHKEMAF